MINLSVALFCPFGTRANYRQASRAASISHLHMHYCYLVQSEKLHPYYFQGTSVPLCSEQYRRLYNLTRIPCRGGFDRLMYSPGLENSYIVVYSQGR